MTLEAVTRETTMELLTDVAAMAAKITVGFIPADLNHRPTVMVQSTPPAVVIRVPGETNAAIEAALYELGSAMKRATDETIPSLPLRYRVIGGSEAAGIEITPEPVAAPAPVYGHIVKARIAWLKPSEWLRRLRPDLPERIIVE